MGSNTTIKIVDAASFLKEKKKPSPKSPQTQALLKLEIGQGFSTSKSKLATIRTNASMHKIGIKTREILGGNVFIWRTR